MKASPTMEQPNLLKLAKQGEPTAIAALMNAVLTPKGITASASLEADCLSIFLESQKPLNQDTLIAFIQKGLLELGNDSIQWVKAQGKPAGETAIAWTREFSLRSNALVLPEVNPSKSIDAANDTLPEAELSKEDELTASPYPCSGAIDSELTDEDLEAPLSFRNWLKLRWRVYALPVAIVVVGGFVAGGTVALWSTSQSQSQPSGEPGSKSRSSPTETQKEAETYLKAMNAAQEKFYKQNKRFASSLEELERSTNVISQSYSYAYRLQAGTNSVITAIPREAELKSYIGIVAARGAASSVCQSLKPSMQAPEKPQIKNKKIECAARSQKIQ